MSLVGWELAQAPFVKQRVQTLDIGQHEKIGQTGNKVIYRIRIIP